MHDTDAEGPDTPPVFADSNSSDTTVPEPPVEAHPTDEQIDDRIVDALRLSELPLDLDGLHAIVNESGVHMPRGPIERRVGVLTENKTIAIVQLGDPLHDHFKIAVPVEAPPPSAPEEDREQVARARAAVVAVLGGHRAYVVEGDRRVAVLPGDGGHDIGQIGAVLVYAEEETAGDRVEIPPTFIAAILADIDLKADGAPDQVEARVLAHLDALSHAGLVESYAVETDVAVSEEEKPTAAEGETEAAEASAAAPDASPAEPSGIMLYRLSLDGERLYAVHGAMAVVEKTLSPLPPMESGPSIEERIAEIQRQATANEARMVESHNTAIAQRDRALRDLTAERALTVQYRDWFNRKGVVDPDAIISTKIDTDPPVHKNYPIEVTIDEEQHWRFVEEFGAARRALAAVEEAIAEEKAEQKSRLTTAENRVKRLEALVMLRPDGITKHTIEKDVRKVVEGDRIVLYSADPHDEGAVIGYEPLSSGTQHALPGTGVPATPPPAAPRARKKKGAKDGEPTPESDTGTILGKAVDKLADEMEKAGASVTRDADGVPTITINVDKSPPADAPDYAGPVLMFIRSYPGATTDRIAVELDIAPVNVVSGLAVLTGSKKIEPHEKGWREVKAPAPEKVDDKPKADGERQTLTPVAIDKNIVDLFLADPWKTSGVLEKNFLVAYESFVGMTLPDSARGLVMKRLESRKKKGHVAFGEGGEDTLLWSVDVDDPRKTGADKAASNPAQGTIPGTEGGAPPPRNKGGRPKGSKNKPRSEGKADAGE